MYVYFGLNALQLTLNFLSLFKVGTVKYHDSINKAQQKMLLSVEQLTQWHLPINPINYAVSYEVVGKKNSALIAAIDQQLAKNKQLDAFFIENNFKDYVLGQSKFRDDLVDDVSDVLGNVQAYCQQSAQCSQHLIDELDEGLVKIQRDHNSATSVIAQLKQTTQDLQTQQHQLVAQLSHVEKQTAKLKNELDEIHQKIYLDPLTGLCNRKSMAKHVDIWRENTPHRKIAIIVLNIDHFPEFTQRFGALLTDVILSKTANKINSYVSDSGLPVRTGGDEFVILLPDVEASIASEIAEKIKLGVEKLRFVSIKSGVRLPKMTLSAIASEMQAKENIDTCISRVSHLKG